MVVRRGAILSKSAGAASMHDGPRAAPISALLCMAVGASSACAGLAGVDDWGSSAGGGATSSSDGGAGGAGGQGDGSGGKSGTCVDGVQNGTEIGVDCDGSCPPCNAPCRDGAGTIGQCVLVPPSGWTGPVIFAEGSAPPGCSDAWSSTVLDLGITIDAPPFGCSACGCGPPVGQTCLGGFVSLYLQADCNGTELPYPSSADGCFSLQPPDENVKSMRTWEPVASNGICVASGGKVRSMPDAKFTIRGRACSAPPLGGSSTCAAGSVCVPETPVGFQSGCIHAPGALACPAGYTSQTTLYQDLVDTRECLGCACGAPLNGACSAVGYAYAAGACTTQVATATDGTCTNLPAINGTVASVKVITGAADGGTCAPAGGGSSGSVVGSYATTLCCP
jgi:hypothetical protein